MAIMLMRFLSGFNSVLLALCVGSVFGADEGREFIAPSVAGDVHASTLVPIGENGDCFAAWFEGAKEGAGDVAICGARRRNGAWEAKRTLAKINPESPHWNPVLRRADDGRICLYFKVGRNCVDWRTYVQESRDDGETWSAARELVVGDVSGGRGPVKNKCLRLKSGRWLAGASREFDPRRIDLTVCWRAFVDISDDDGRTWRRSSDFPVPADAPKWGKRPFGVIQPTLWEDADGVHALMRATDGWIWRTDSADDGETWCECYRSSLENINSGIDCVRASNGRLYLVMNGCNRDEKQREWGSRNHLEIRESADGGKTWRVLEVLADDAFKQADGRRSEYSYPAIVELCKGALAVTYTFNRHQIAFATIRIEGR